MTPMERESLVRAGAATARAPHWSVMCRRLSGADRDLRTRPGPFVGVLIFAWAFRACAAPSRVAPIQVPLTQIELAEPPPSATANAVVEMPSASDTKRDRHEGDLDDATKRAFATYLVGMHNRIHVQFAERFLESLDSLPSNHPANQPDLVTTVEIMIDGVDGTVRRVGIVRPSGVTIFDVGVLASIQDASPFEVAPTDIRSADGNVVVTWTFHRDRMLSCSTRDAIPAIRR